LRIADREFQEERLSIQIGSLFPSKSAIGNPKAAMTAPSTSVSGILLIDKPAGPTSHDVVLRVRRAFGLSRVGHSGTLDPMATGLLVLLVGPATRFQSKLQGLAKSYSGTALLGVETDTGDQQGKETARRSVPELSAEELQGRLSRWLGRSELPLPRFCAVKYKGKPLYHYARKGVEVPTRVRVQEVMAWQVTGWSAPLLHFSIRCAGGTYVRSLVQALGRDVGCGATLWALRRDSVGPFSVQDALPIDDFEGLSRQGQYARLLPPSAAAFLG